MFYQTKRRTIITVTSLLLIGAIIRVVWVIIRPSRSFAVGEAYNVAVALATKGSFGDAYFIGQGPTAHLLPISPLIAGGVYTVFGIDTITSSLILLIWCLAQVGVGYFLLMKVFRKIGISQLACLLGLMILSLLPVFIGQETFDFRYWEGALAVVCGTTTLLCFIAWDSQPSIGWGRVSLAAFLAALTFFVSPALGLGAYVAAAIFLWRNFDGIRIVKSVGIAALMLAAFLTPWVVRNNIVMGHPIILRDNFGLEFALANYPGAIGAIDPLEARTKRIVAIHPARNAALWPIVKQEGEAAYADRLGTEANAWVRANPGQFIRLLFRHVTEFYFPQAWQFSFTGSGFAAGPRAAFIGLISLLGILGLFYRTVWGDRRFAYVAAMVLAPAIPYALIEPVPRYMYIVFGLLTFLAADFAILAAASLRRSFVGRFPDARISPWKHANYRSSTATSEPLTATAAALRPNGGNRPPE